MSAPRRIELPDLPATERLAAAVAALARRGDAILLDGPLGAGKTAFARAFLRAASGQPALEVPSPTFTLVQGYETRLGTVHHFDLWRLDGPAALAELGWDEARDDIVLVEWPDRLGPQRPPEALTVVLGPAVAGSGMPDLTASAASPGFGPASPGVGPASPGVGPASPGVGSDARLATLSGWAGRICRIA